MAQKPLRPCRHPGCTTLVTGGYCDLHRPKDSRSDAAKSWHWMYLTPEWTEDLRPGQLLREPFAGNVPGAETGRRPRKWTTSSRTAETGQCSRTAAISRAFAIPAIVARRWPKCSKSEALCVPAGSDDQRNAWAHGRGGCVCAAFPCPPPRQKVWAEGRKTARPLRARFFPHEDFREYMACQIRTRRPEREGVYGSAGCDLRGARKYCASHPGWCCKECPLQTSCDHACRNTPDVCGYATPHDTCQYHAPPRISRKEGPIHGRQTATHSTCGSKRTKTPDSGGG